MAFKVIIFESFISNFDEDLKNRLREKFTRKIFDSFILCLSKTAPKNNDFLMATVMEKLEKISTELIRQKKSERADN